MLNKDWVDLFLFIIFVTNYFSFEIFYKIGNIHKQIVACMYKEKIRKISIEINYKR